MKPFAQNASVNFVALGLNSWSLINFVYSVRQVMENSNILLCHPIWWLAVPFT